MLHKLLNNTVYLNKYKTHPEAIVISCFFNPQNSPYRISAFNHFYESIKHLNHKIIECVIGDSKPQLPFLDNIDRVYTESLLWHKETLLNKIISELPKKYKYIFWVDADVIFTNKNWLLDGVKALQHDNIIQPFEYCVHLDKDQLKPEFNLDFAKAMYDPKGSITQRSKRLWRSFASNYVNSPASANSENYDVHGHVGFAWGARREILDTVPLYDKALIGGADHIIAHAAANQIPHCCITKSFKDDLDEVNTWSRQFSKVVKGKLSYVPGDLYHIWHGDIDKRDYFKRIVDFTSKAKKITMRDSNGLHVTKDKDSIAYMNDYFSRREVTPDDGFFNSMMLGYLTNNGILGGALGGNLMGGMVGDIINDSENQSNNNQSPVDSTQSNNNDYQGSTFS